MSQNGRRRARGQSLAEFAIALPILLALVGVTLDAARVFEAWLKLESGTRDAAQYLATSAADPLDVNYGGTNSNAKAGYILTLETGHDFTVSASQEACSTPLVTTSYTESTTAADGATTAHPIGIGQVTACLPFRMLFAYPGVTVDGDWILRSSRTYRVVVGR